MNFVPYSQYVTGPSPKPCQKSVTFPKLAVTLWKEPGRNTVQARVLQRALAFQGGKALVRHVRPAEFLIGQYFSKRRL